MGRAETMERPVQEALRDCIADEQTYQFTHFSHRDAWELGHALVDLSLIHISEPTRRS